METDELLRERGRTYGPFIQNAEVAQVLKFAMRNHTTMDIAPDMKEALDQICSKISRILTGSHMHIDNWDDMAGYAKLVANRLRDHNDTGGVRSGRSRVGGGSLSSKRPEHDRSYTIGEEPSHRNGKPHIGRLGRLGYKGSQSGRKQYRTGTGRSVKTNKRA